MMSQTVKHIGVDEVGRGPLAGPLVMCGVSLYDYSIEKLSHNLVKDSKKHTKRTLSLAYDYIMELVKEGLIGYVIYEESASTIDSVGIGPLLRQGVSQIVKELTKKTEDHIVFLDGGLYMPDDYRGQSYVKGDAVYPIISAASIIAKMYRDKIMREYAEVYTQYSFEKNVGYGTAAHREALLKFGSTDIHRKTFLKGIF